MKKKKLAALSLAVVMTTTAPISAFAETNTTSDNANESVKVESQLEERKVEKEKESELKLAPVEEKQEVKIIEETEVEKENESELMFAPIEEPIEVRAQEEVKRATGMTVARKDSTYSNTIKINETTMLRALPTPETYEGKIQWNSSDPTVATVAADSQNNKEAIVTGVNKGQTNITVTYTDKDGNEKTSAGVIIYVNNGGETTKPTAISLSPKNITLTPNGTQSISATITPSNATNKEITWTSSNTDVATVDQSGKVTAHKAGTATINAVSKADGNIKDTASVTVNENTVEVKPTAISLSSNNITLTPNEAQKVIATITPSNATNKNITWTSSNTDVATVDQSGKVTAHKEGTATITATSQADNTIKATSKVTVVPAKTVLADKITNVKVYYDKVTGYAEPYSTVRLYKDEFRTGYSTTADSNGYFSISYSFGSRNYRYWNDRYWDGTRYWDWDEYYDYYGYYWNDYPYYRYYDGYYYTYNYDLSRFSLKSYDSLGRLIDDESLSNSKAYYYDGYYDGYYYPGYYNRYYYDYDRYYDYKVYPTSLSLDSARDTVSGYLKSYPNRYVAVYRNGSFLGSSYVDSNGYFKVNLNTYIGSTSNLDFYVDRYYKETTPKTTTTTTDTKTFRTVITIGSKNITQRINGADRTKTMDVEAYIKDGRTMLPIRFVAESLGYDVTYRNSSRSAIISDGKDIIIFYLDSADFYVNGVKKQFQVKPEIKNDRTMLPISEVARALGLTHGDKGSGRNIEWDSATRTVVIELKK
ncbi:Ig-like domain-containing protein [Peptoniphilus sp. MSJ-1]|uniref:Ig-like domain-containing protein n=1 Tax=Peptoniphilus ovalis TaxID=2841503 RepID=A0ABS6FFV8_9FIRM|nr:Ig-like domain-containing protein [Peptoniphilus ovalis]MBU5668353.1 Ig-like domain-containing protein [Peptoniphilus ovalis]